MVSRIRTTHFHYKRLFLLGLFAIDDIVVVVLRLLIDRILHIERLEILSTVIIMICNEHLLDLLGQVGLPGGFNLVVLGALGISF